MDWLGVDLRRLGTAMLVFGIAGMVVAAAVAAGLIGGAISARSLDQRLAADQARVVAALDRVDETMAQAVTTVDNAGGTLTATSETLTSAGDVLGQVGTTAEELRTSLDFTILGTRPLSAAASQFGELAVQVRGFQTKAAALSENLAGNAADTRALATQVDDLRDEIAVVSTRVQAYEATGELVRLLVGLILLLGVLVAWLAVVGAACAWVGLRLRRHGTVLALEAPAP